MLWLGIDLPRFALQAATHGPPAEANGPTMPVALCAEQSARGPCVLQANDAALAIGVRPGMTRASAQTLAHELRLLDRNPAREERLLEQLAIWAAQFTPQLSLVPASTEQAGVLLQVQASLRLFGGLQRLVQRISQGIAELGLQARIAHAPTATGAWLMARQRHDWGTDDVAQLPTLLGAVQQGQADRLREGALKCLASVAGDVAPVLGEHTVTLREGVCLLMPSAYASTLTHGTSPPEVLRGCMAPGCAAEASWAPAPS